MGVFPRINLQTSDSIEPDAGVSGFSDISENGGVRNTKEINAEIKDTFKPLPKSREEFVPSDSYKL